MERKVKKFDDVFQAADLNMDKLRALAWNGVPTHAPLYRTQIWKLLLDYMPEDKEIRAETLTRKREEYESMVLHYFGKVQFSSVEDLKASKQQEMSAYEKKSMKQIMIDVYRTQPDQKIFSCNQI